MIKQECQDRSGYKYAKFLLQDKQRELRSLERKHSLKLIASGDYHSCRRSLLQAINQLETLLRGDTRTQPGNRAQPQEIVFIHIAPGPN